ncbi:MAG: class I tRNA ligase family protein, partial [Candidatus Methanofastidiosa archaeon]|nr:class I tRNA ligase family protein [Candidatus Methanofastidiosa archaeon]
TLLDRWIASELSLTIEKVEDAVECYQFANALREAENFIWHLFADNYLEMIKYRLYEKRLPSEYIKNVYDDALKLIAPILVHITEEVHSHLIGGKSIHNSKWPSNYSVDEESLKIGRLAKDIITEIRRYKSETGMPLNKEMDKITIFTPHDIFDVIDDIKGTMNIKEIMVSKDTPEFEEIISNVTPEFSIIGPKFGKDTSTIVELLTAPENAKRLIEEGELEINGFLLKKEYISKIERVYEQKGKRVELIEHPEFYIKLH